MFHQNVPALVQMFHLTRNQARAIMATCPNCQKFQLPSFNIGVNPRGLGSCELWQMDVTHVPAFRRLKYIHVSIDTFSGAAFASAHAGEKSKDVQNHLIQAFATIGIPKEIKTDNGPAYVSAALKNFFQKWGITRKTGIPHSPVGQSMVERSHQTLKRITEQQRGGEETNSLAIRLAKVLFTVNFLNCSFEDPNPPVVKHFNNNTRLHFREKPPVLVKESETQDIQGPFPLITWGRGYGCPPRLAQSECQGN